MKYKSAKDLILHVCDKYWDAKRSYKKLLIYCFIEQGYNFPLTIEAIMSCYSTETIRRQFQALKRDGVIVVDSGIQEDWDRKEQRVRAQYSPRRKKSHLDPNWQSWIAKDQEGRKQAFVNGQWIAI